ncbi:uncharacterized protein LOC133121355 [Conger conger]|uniref:uncharacterized protein LOC133121355 n=1 Tax=Conger conger TaxID=82655 RepID=UPI002A5AF55A|nr:uncharacterized protein LOC133121355 [Conger conger]
MTVSPGSHGNNTTSFPSSPIIYSGNCSEYPPLCCDGFNSSCYRGCFCDVACLRNHDCCPDFTATCVTGEQNGTAINTTVSPGSHGNDTTSFPQISYSGNCSEYPPLCCDGFNSSCYRGCFCDEACLQNHDCCPDFTATCVTGEQNGTAINMTVSPGSHGNNTTSFPSSPIIYSGNCSEYPPLCCDGFNSSCYRGCFCDVACLRNHDCCPDFTATCVTGEQNGTAINTTVSPGSHGNDTTSFPQISYSGNCSEYPPLCCDGFNSSCYRGCFCDEACLQNHDCCPDFTATCVTGKMRSFVHNNFVMTMIM